jgi:hypothetical protein
MKRCTACEKRRKLLALKAKKFAAPLKGAWEKFDLSKLKRKLK